MSRRTIWTDGIEFECAEADGEILSVELGCREEFLDAYGDKWSGNDLPEPTVAAILSELHDVIPQPP